MPDWNVKLNVVGLDAYPQMAVLESIEACVYALIMEGLIKNTWELADPGKKPLLLEKYLDINYYKTELLDYGTQKQIKND